MDPDIEDVDREASRSGKLFVCGGFSFFLRRIFPEGKKSWVSYLVLK